MRVYASAEMTLTDTNDGISITGIDRYYMASSSSSGITVDSRGWEPDPQETNPISRYHWSYEVVNYSDGAAIPSKPAVIGVYGKEGKEGIDAVTVSLSSEAHTFAGTESKAIASSITIDVSAFKGNQRIPTSIGTVTGGITGQLTHDELGRGTTSNKLVINVASSLAKGNGTLSIPIVADGRTFNKVFSWSVAFKGTDGTTTYTWIRYADTPTSGMSDSALDKKYIGLAFNQTTQDESEDYSDYQWSLMPQNIDIGGRNYWVIAESSEHFSRTWAAGTLYQQENAVSSGLIPTEPNEQFSVNYPSYASQTMYYNKSKEYIGSFHSLQMVTPNIGANYEFPNSSGRPVDDVPAYVSYTFRGTFLKDNPDYKIMLEKGDTPTDWSPAPEDLYRYSDEVAQAKADAERIKAQSYADGKVTAEEKKRIAQAEQVLKDAKAHALQSIENIDIGGRNLIKESSKPITLTPRNTGAAGDNFNFITLKAPMTKGETYTLSFNMEITHGTFNRVSIYPQHGHIGLAVVDLVNNRGIYTFTAVEDTDTNNILIYAGIAGETRGNAFVVTEYQLEKGNTATDWSPAPEDFYKYSEDVAQAKAEAERVKAEAYADDIVTAEEEARIEDADAKLAAAKQYAVDQILADKTIKDTRNDNQTPAWYYTNHKKQTIKEFKFTSTMGVGASEGMYGILETEIPWNDASGGPVKQTFRVTSKTFKRSGTTTSWSRWVSYDDMAETAKSDAATAKGIADGAAASASAANSLLVDIASDSKLTATEKKAAKKEWDIIVGEKPKIDSSADTYGIITQKTAYNTAYNTLNNYLSGLLANLNTTSNIVGTTFRANFKAYYNARQDLLNKIADGAKSLVDEIEVGGRNLIIQQTITRGQYLTASNTLTTDAQWFYTDYIPVSGYKKMTTSGYTNLGRAPSVVYYDSSKNFVRGINNNGQSRAKDITINSGEAFIRFSGMIADLPTIKLEKGNKATDWTPAPEDVEAAYIAVAQAKAEAEREKAESYADGKVTAEEEARIKDANAKLAAAKKHAENISKVQDIGNGNKKFINVGGLVEQTASRKGYLVIKTPITSAYMTKMKISGYNYSIGKTNIDVSVSFYAYINNAFHQYSFISSGDYSYDKVQLARDSSGKTVVIIGNQSDVYGYPVISIDEALVTYGTPPDSFKDGFSAEIVTDISMYTNAVDVPGNDTQSQINKSVKSTDVEYYLSTSSTGLSGGKWQTTAPPWDDGKYMWSRTKVVLNDGTPIYNPSATGTNITGATGGTGATGRGVSSIVEQFYLSDSKTARVGGKWSDTMPTWSPGKYIWTRSLITYTTGTPATSTTEPLVSSEWEAVNEIEIGGRNLAVYSTIGEYSGGINRNTLGSKVDIDGSKINVKSQLSDLIAFSIDDVSQYDKLNISFFSDLTSPTIYYKFNNTNQSNTKFTKKGNLFTGTLTVPDGAVSLVIGLGEYPRPAIFKPYYIDKVMVEKGNTATDWTPAPEDTQSQIDETKEQVKKTVKTVTEEYYQSTSATSQTGGGWTETAPTWQEGKFIFIRSKITYVDGTTDYTPIVNITGAKGDTGSDGKSQWVHIRYSPNPTGSGMEPSPSSTTKYIGIAVTNSATVPAFPEFNWSKYVGDKGDPGEPGQPGGKGDDGKTTYTWVRYADTPTSGMNNFPSGKKYIGLAFNKTTQNETNNYDDYQWSLMPQSIEIGAKTQDELENISHIHFDGNGYIEFPDEAKNLVHGGTEATIEFWNKQDSLAYGILQLSGFADSNGNLYPYQNYTTAYLDVFRTNRTGAIKMKKPVNRWHHFAVTTHPAEGWKLYQDGVLVYTANAQSTVNVSHLKFRVGNNSGNRYSRGGYRDIRLWNKARTHQEIITNMNQDVTEDDNGLVGYWKVNEGSGNTVADLVNGNDGVIVNGSWKGIQNKLDEKAGSTELNDTLTIVREEREKLGDLRTDFQSTKSNLLITHSEEWMTTITETANDVGGMGNRIENIEQTKEQIDTFFKFDDALTIAKSNAQTKLRLTNDEIQFLDGETKGTYITGNNMVTQNLTIQDKLNLPNHTMESQEDLTIIRFIG